MVSVDIDSVQNGHSFSTSHQHPDHQEIYMWSKLHVYKNVWEMKKTNGLTVTLLTLVFYSLFQLSLEIVTVSYTLGK